MEKSTASEKRDYPRFNVDLPVRYSRDKLLLKYGYGRYGRTVNASEGGLLVHLPEETEIDQQLTLQLLLPSPSELNTLETSAKVVWVDIHLRKNWSWDYRTGVKFVDISPKNMAKFKNFLMTLPQKPPDTS
jgi:c-di-GMP-binding flagellar brake protein YcgR